MKDPDMILKVNDPEDVEQLFQLFDELRDNQDNLGRLHRTVSGWKVSDTSDQNTVHLYRRPVELFDGRVLNVGVRQHLTGGCEIIIRMG